MGGGFCTWDMHTGQLLTTSWDLAHIMYEKVVEHKKLPIHMPSFQRPRPQFWVVSLQVSFFVGNHVILPKNHQTVMQIGFPWRKTTACFNVIIVESMGNYNQHHSNWPSFLAMPTKIYSWLHILVKVSAQLLVPFSRSLHGNPICMTVWCFFGKILPDFQKRKPVD